MALNRIKPVLPAEHMKTYQVRSPVSTHFRPATCAEVECASYLFGWQTVVPADSAAAGYIRHDRSRSHAEEREPGGMARFVFGAGQQGFPPAHDHAVRTDRPEVYLVRDGDFRGNPRGTQVRRHVRPDDWIEDFAEHQDKLATRLERG
jgi:hypothetical protein